MSTDYEAAMLRTLNGSLNDLLERMNDRHHWLISYCDTRTPMRPDAPVYLAVGHRSVNNGNMLARIDCAEVERLEYLDKSIAHRTTANGFRASYACNEAGEEREAFEVLTARDALAALYGFVICHHADALESDKRSENEPR